MAPSSYPPPRRIAILGGGLAGGAAFRVLSKNDNLIVDIFESAPAFREQGQGVGMNPNAMAALEISDSSAEDLRKQELALKRLVTKAMSSR